MLMFPNMDIAKELTLLSRRVRVPILGFLAFLVLYHCIIEPKNSSSDFSDTCNFYEQYQFYGGGFVVPLSRFGLFFGSVGIDLYHCLRFRYHWFSGASSSLDFIDAISRSCFVTQIMLTILPFLLAGFALIPLFVCGVLSGTPIDSSPWFMYCVVCVTSPILEELFSHYYPHKICFYAFVLCEACLYVSTGFQQVGWVIVLTRIICAFNHYMNARLSLPLAIVLHMCSNAVSVAFANDVILSLNFVLFYAMLQIMLSDHQVICQSSHFSAIDLLHIARNRISRWLRIYNIRACPDILWILFDDIDSSAPLTYGHRQVFIDRTDTGWSGFVALSPFRGVYAGLGPTFQSQVFTGHSYDRVLDSCRDNLIRLLYDEFPIELQSSSVFDVTTFFLDVWVFVMNMSCASSHVHRIALVTSFITARFRDCLKRQFDDWFQVSIVIPWSYKFYRWVARPRPVPEASDPCNVWACVLNQQHYIQFGAYTQVLDTVPAEPNFLEYMSLQFAAKYGVPTIPISLRDEIYSLFLSAEFSLPRAEDRIIRFYRDMRKTKSLEVATKEESGRRLGAYYLNLATSLLQAVPLLSKLFTSANFLPQSDDFVNLESLESFSLSSIIDFMSSMVKIGTSRRIVHCVIIVMSFFTALAQNPFSFSWSSYTNLINEYERVSIPEKASVIDHLMTSIEWVISTGVAVYNGKTDVLDLNAARAWMRQTSHYVGYNHPISHTCFDPETGVKDGLSARQLLENIDRLTTRGVTIAAAARVNKSISVTDVTARLGVLNHISINIGAYLRGCAMRKAPFGVLVVGPSACAKSYFIDIIRVVLQMQLGLSTDPEYTYSMPSENNYPDGFKSPQHTIIIDDAGSRAPGPGVVDQGVAGIIKFCNNLPCQMEAAAVEEKGKNFFTGDLVLVTANTDHLYTHASFTQPSAALRRLPYVIRLRPKAQTPTGELVRSPREDGEDLDNWWIMDLERVGVMGEGDPPPVKRTKLLTDCGDIKELLRVLGQACRDHQNRQNDYIASKNSLMSLSKCSVCMCHPTTCMCAPVDVCDSCGIFRSICVHNNDGLPRQSYVSELAQPSSHLRRGGSLRRGFGRTGYNRNRNLRPQSPVVEDDEFYPPSEAESEQSDPAVHTESSEYFMSYPAVVLAEFGTVVDWIILSVLLTAGALILRLYTRASQFVRRSLPRLPCSATPSSRFKTGAWVVAALISLLVVLRAMKSVEHKPCVVSAQADVHPTNFSRLDGTSVPQSVWNFNRTAPPLSAKSRTAAGNAVANNLVCISGSMGRLVVEKEGGIASNGYFQILGAPYVGWVVTNNHTVYGSAGNQVPKNIAIQYGSSGRNVSGAPAHVVHSKIDFSSCEVARGPGDVLFIKIPSLVRSKGMYDYLLESPYVCTVNTPDLLGFDAPESLVLGKIEYVPHQWGGIRYPYLQGATKNGDCGRPLVGLVDGCLVILGFHTSATDDSATSAFGQATILTKDIVDKSIPIPVICESGIDVQSEDVCPIGEVKFSNKHTGINSEFGPKSNVEFLGRIGEMTSYNTDVVDTPFVGPDGQPWFQRWFPDKRKVPPILDPKAKIQGVSVGYKPKKNLLDNVSAACQSGWNIAILDECKTSIVRFLSSTLAENISGDVEHVHGTLSYHHAINSVPGMDGLEMLNMRTGFGFPHNTNKMDQFYTTISPKNGLEYHLKPAPGEQLKRLDGKVRSGATPAFVFRGARKDEPISVEKAESRGPRLIFAAPTLLTILIRKYFGLMVRQFYRTRIVSGIAIGLNCFNQEWHKLYHHLTSVGFRCIAGDFGNFDQKLPAVVTSRSLAILKEVNLGIPSAQFDTSDTTAMNSILYVLLHPLMLIDTELYQLYGVNPSGQALTTHTNCVSVLLLLLYVWVSVGYAADDFFHVVRFTTYGDDHLLCVPTGFERFDYNAIAVVMAKHAIDYTTFDKQPAFGKTYDDIHDVEFLKRQFRRSKVGIIAPLAKDSILRRLYISKKPAVGILPLDHQRDVLSSVWRDTLLYPDLSDLRDSISSYCQYKGIPMATELFPSLEQYIASMGPADLTAGFDTTQTTFY